MAVVIDFEGGGRYHCEPDRRRRVRVRVGDTGRDDVPSPVHRRRGAQLLLEGPSSRVARRAADGIAGHPGPRRHRRDGLHRRSVSTGTRASTTCSSMRRPRRFARPGGRRIRRGRRLLAGDAWLRLSGLTLSRPLKLDYRPVSRVENFCATGSDAFRNACYAVASGAYDVVMAVGVEKLKDSGFSGSDRRRAADDGTLAADGAAPCSACSPPPTARATGSTDDGDEGRADEDRLEEPSQRRPATSGRSSAGRWRRRRSAPHRWSPARWACSTARGERRRRRRGDRSVPRTRTATPIGRST